MAEPDAKPPRWGRSTGAPGVQFDDVARSTATIPAKQRPAAKDAALNGLPAGRAYGAVRRVLEVLLARLNWKRGYCYHASLNVITRDAGYTKRHVQRALNALETGGHIVRRHRRSRSGDNGVTHYAIPALMSLPRDVDVPRVGTPMSLHTYESVTHDREGTEADARERAPVMKTPNGVVTDAAGRKRYPFTDQTLRTVERAGVEPGKLVERYELRTKRKHIRNPNAYLLQMALDEVAKALGTPAEQLKPIFESNNPRDVGLLVAAVLEAQASPLDTSRLAGGPVSDALLNSPLVTGGRRVA